MAVFMGAMTAFWATSILAFSVIFSAVGYLVGAALVVGAFLLRPKGVRPTAPNPTRGGGARRHSRVFAAAVLLETVATLVAVVVGVGLGLCTAGYGVVFLRHVARSPQHG
jgi:hypothetical protein